MRDKDLVTFKIVFSLRIVSVILLLVLIILPVVPELIYRLSKSNFTGLRFNIYYGSVKLSEIGKEGNILVIKKENSAISISERENDLDFVENRIIISKIGVESIIIEGEDDRAMDYGVWHRPESGDPDRGGNMVLTGHRFRYLPPNNKTFYNLDKLAIGDQVDILWYKKWRKYEIVGIKTVNPTDTYIEDNTIDHILTIYTCTPLWTANKRLVITAKAI